MAPVQSGDAILVDLVMPIQVPCADADEYALQVPALVQATMTLRDRKVLCQYGTLFSMTANGQIRVLLA
jgi:hypothetical protein